MIRKAVEAIIIQNSECMIVHKVKNSYGDKVKGVWDFPKGGVESSDEDDIQALFRELYEETGSRSYVVKKQFEEKICFHFDEGTRKKIGYQSQITTVFLVEYTGDRTDLTPIDEEIDQVRFVHLDKVMSLLSHQETKDYFQKNYLANIKNI